VVSLTFRALYARGKKPGIYRIGGWVDTRAGLDGVEGTKISCLSRKSYPDSSVLQRKEGKKRK
jgi:hypothetical protein